MTQAATNHPPPHLNGGTIHFLSSFSLTTCNDFILIHHGASLKGRDELIMEKHAFSCRRHFPRGKSSDIASVSTHLLF
jgi:hypothetical protein